MADQKRNPLFLTVLVTASLLLLGGLVAWGAGLFDSRNPSDPATGTYPMQTRSEGGGQRATPAGKAAPGGQMMSPGPIRPDAPAGTCPYSGMSTGGSGTAGSGVCPATGATGKTSELPPECRPQKKEQKKTSPSDEN